MSQYRAAVQKAPEAAAPQNVIETPEEKKVPIAENTRLAKRIAAGVIALSVLVLGPIKLSSLHSRAEKVFKSGTESKYVVSIYNDIRNSANAANAISAVTGDRELKVLAEDILKANDPEELLSLFDKLKFRADQVVAEYEKSGAADVTKVKNEYSTITSAYRTIGNNVYWQYADKYNSAASGFPAGFMAWYSGLDRLPDKTN